MKVLVALKRVPDSENSARLRLSANGTVIDASALTWKTNPFDELALETALRLTEDGRAPRTRVGEVVVVAVGPAPADSTLRSALALGATRALRLAADEYELDGFVVARALAAVAMTERPDLIVLGKRTVDGASGQVGQQLAELLDWPCATACSRARLHGSMLEVRRELEGGAVDLELDLPAVVTVDLRIGSGASVRSAITPDDYHYADGVRFAALPAIIKAKNKPLRVCPLEELVPTPTPLLHYVEFELPPRRSACTLVSSTAELAERVKNLVGATP